MKSSLFRCPEYLVMERYVFEGRTTKVQEQEQANVVFLMDNFGGGTDDHILPEETVISGHQLTKSDGIKFNESWRCSHQLMSKMKGC